MIIIKKNIIKLIIHDEMISSGKSEQEILNEIILERYIDPYWYQIVKTAYEKRMSIGKFLALIWMNTDVIGKRDMIDLVKYASKKTANCNSDLPNPTNPEWHHFCDLLESLSLYLSTALATRQSNALKNSIVKLSDIIADYNNNNINIGQLEIYQIIIENWYYLNDKVKVYNLLGTMAEMQTGWQDHPSDRIELLTLLR